jgi:hypothetical protein
MQFHPRFPLVYLGFFWSHRQSRGYVVGASHYNWGTNFVLIHGRLTKNEALSQHEVELSETIQSPEKWTETIWFFDMFSSESESDEVPVELKCIFGVVEGDRGCSWTRILPSSHCWKRFGVLKPPVEGDVVQTRKSHRRNAGGRECLEE